MDTHVGDGPATPLLWMRAAVTRWLHAPDGVVLRGWLHERGLPPVGHRDEPHITVLSGLPQGAARADAERTMAGVVRTELDDHATAYSDEGIWNLLLLAAGLSVPATLSAPLHRWYQRRHLKGREANGIPLTEALRMAIIENQADARYRTVWMTLLRGGADPYLGSGVTAGFDGILWMRGEDGRVGDVDAIGEALGYIAKFLDSVQSLQPRRRPELRGYLARVMNAYPHLNWPVEFIRLADRFRWDQWVVESLPTLVFPRSLEEEQSELVMWTPLVRLVANPTVIEELCEGHVSVLKLPASRVGEVQNNVRYCELLRRRHDLPTSTAMLNTVVCAVAGLEDPKAAVQQRYNLAHLAYLTDLNVQPRPLSRRKSTRPQAYS